MKPKTTFTLIIAALFIATLFFYHDTMTLAEIVLAFTSSGGLIGWFWKWFDDDQKAIRVKWLEKQNSDNQTRIKNLREQKNTEIKKRKAIETQLNTLKIRGGKINR